VEDLRGFMRDWAIFQDVFGHLGEDLLAHGSMSSLFGQMGPTLRKCQDDALQRELVEEHRVGKCLADEIESGLESAQEGEQVGGDPVLFPAEPDRFGNAGISPVVR
jgi:hypothetical protein